MLNTYCSNRPGEIVPGTAGWPVPGYELRLVDEEGSALEGPAVGALHVRGDSCAAYYWRNQEKTKLSILGEWFATGDRCARNADGTYSHVGRVDDMLKVAGLWVSPVEVERVLTSHPSVAEAAIVGIRGTGTVRLVAYVRCANGAGDQALARELRVWCDERLSAHERPNLVTFVDDLPRTRNGKVQRYRLRQLATRAEHQHPDVTSALARTWSEILGLEVTGEDDFFALGGDSLTASELIFAIEEKFGARLAIGDLLAAPTVEQLANRIVNAGDPGANAPVRLLDPLAIGSELFMVPGIGCSVLQLRPLATALEHNVMLYGLPAWECVPAHETVTDEARWLVSGLRSLREAGPYWIGGHSSGGVVALEMGSHGLQGQTVNALQDC